MGEGFGQRLEELEARRLDDLAADPEDGGVVHCLLEIVVDARRLEVEEQLDVDLERLLDVLLVVEIAMPAPEGHVVEDDPVAQVAPPGQS